MSVQGQVAQCAWLVAKLNVDLFILYYVYVLLFLHDDEDELT